MTQKILIVDDSKTQCLTLKLKLEKKGYEVLEAENGMDAIRLVYEKNPAIVISDVLMPNINGYHLCRLIKRDKLTSHIPVILLTVLDKKIDKFWGLRAGADAFFCKGASDDELYAIIEKFISQSQKNTDITLITDTTQYDFTSKVAEILDESLVKSTLTNEFRDLAEFVLDDKIFNRKLFSLLSSILDYNLLAVFYNESDKKDKIIYFEQNECDIDAEVLQNVKDRISAKIIACNVEAYSNLRLEYKMTETSSNEEDFEESISDINEFKSEYIVPFENEGKLIGAIALFHKDSSKYVNKSIVDTIISELKMVLKIKWLYSETKLLSIVDPLTQLYNRRYFQQVLEKEFLRSNRYSSPLSLAMIDIDNFKQLNDTFGHQFGDEVLQVVSGLFKESLRKTDYVARYGGEELIAILPETSIEQAIIPIERLRCRIADQMFMREFQRVNVTVSIGISQNTFDFVSTDAFIKETDNALYEAKEKGKNRIELAIKRK
ncbi:MAG: diguanylate cyclase [Candidatus Gastranaerophilales bacterium]|nr:diguanylate cyclase [Candidatus Gastranaerophilales bacterium]